MNTMTNILFIFHDPRSDRDLIVVSRNRRTFRGSQVIVKRKSISYIRNMKVNVKVKCESLRYIRERGLSEARGERRSGQDRNPLVFLFR